MPKISVIIPVYNTALYLRHCLDSVCGQTLHDIEIICINDASSDHSQEILEEYAKRDSRIRLIAFSENCGTATARNSGITAARGEYLAFVDSDDFADRDFLFLLYEKARESGADIVKGCARFIGSYKFTIPFDNNDIKRNKFHFATCFWTAIYNKKFIETNNIIFPLGVKGEDIVFLTKAIIVSKGVAIEDRAYYNYSLSERAHKKTAKHVGAIIAACHMIIDYANDADICAENYLIIFQPLFRKIVSLCSRVDAQYLDIIHAIAIDGLTIMYAKCKHQELFSSNSKDKVIKLLLSGDMDSLAEYIRKPRATHVAADLRMRVTKSET